MIRLETVQFASLNQQLRDAVAENGTLKSRVADLENGIRESLALPHGEEELAILVDLLIPKP